MEFEKEFKDQVTRLDKLRAGLKRDSPEDTLVRTWREVIMFRFNNYDDYMPEKYERMIKTMEEYVYERD